MTTSSEPSSAITSLVRAIHASDLRLGLAVTGGGSQAIADLLVVPGGSRTLIEAIIPYSPESLTAWLGSRPEHFCAPRTARSMAMAAFCRARELCKTAEGRTTESTNIAGIACTASLASDRPKRGAHRVHLALQTVAGTTTHSLELTKGARSRAEEERLVASMLLHLIAAAAGIAECLPLALREGELLDVQQTRAPRAWQELVAGSGRLVRHAHAKAEPQDRTPLRDLVIFPGAFNPRHDGHRRMAAVAAKLLERPVEYEISIENVDKPRLDYTEMATRLAQFDDAPLWFTRTPTFLEKSLFFQHAFFIVGVDTIERINDPKYYGGSEANRDNALRLIGVRGCRFLVFGRADSARGFRTLSDLQLADPLCDLCQEVREDDFRADVSSTELRRSTELEN
jgi:nicotinamide mononucleotide (NMN) deamidase PncC